jgi:hypothetical protein
VGAENASATSAPREPLLKQALLPLYDFDFFPAFFFLVFLGKDEFHL